VREALEEAFLVASIIRKTEAPERVRRASVSEELNIQEALDRYFENNPTLKPFVEDMKSYARQLEHELFEEEQGRMQNVEPGAKE
jgi:hypothetical protein